MQTMRGVNNELLARLQTNVATNIHGQTHALLNINNLRSMYRTLRIDTKLNTNNRLL